MGDWVLGIDSSFVSVALTAGDSYKRVFCSKTEFKTGTADERCHTAFLATQRFVKGLPPYKDPVRGPQNRRRASRRGLAGLTTQETGEGRTAALSSPLTVAQIESPLLGNRNIQTTIKQSLVNGAIQAALRGMGVPVLMVQPTSWKLAALGRGNLSKDEVRESVHRLFPVSIKACGDDQDKLDSFAIYIMAYDMVTSGTYWVSDA